MCYGLIYRKGENIGFVCCRPLLQYYFLVIHILAISVGNWW